MKGIFFSSVFLLLSFSKLHAQSGCTDAAANNYNASAKTNDGSCKYNDIMLTPSIKYAMDNTLRETSGLLWWDGKVWTFNDSGGLPAIYAIDSATGTITKTVTISNATNIDWEEITQDDQYIYIGDFGNNASGNRKNLRIYKIAKADVQSSTSVTAQAINFSYSDQTDFTATASNQTNYDCEAFVAYNDSLFLFSKDWVDFHSRLYSLPKTPGTYTARLKADILVDGLITGATILPSQKTIVLTGYSTVLVPFLYLLYDFSNNDFFAANKRKVQLNSAFTQMEGIASISDTYFFVSNEFFQRSIITTPARLQSINLASLLTAYYTALPYELQSFQAMVNDSDVTLRWQLNSGNDLTGITVQRKKNTEANFSDLQTTGVNETTYIDKDALQDNSTIQYRLKLTDKNQEVHYSKVVAVSKNKSNAVTITATSDKLKIISANNISGTIDIISTNGSLVNRSTISGTNPTIDISNLPAGVYVARLSMNAYSQSAKFFKQ
ncbi:T9SS type A sorting domain-containing protein [Pinibacter aurantiacus]|uniref:T9SS type A sorting domain-containing protein n=1 Tax=Pinibacter aurantiacus TaxID=2851599 RepID=A0A9E2W993_9BACT|nr:T9SS type A sorting domain-containing protein [Pinibacter aurantiacus]MBV4359342.1 T9SS type A sorting domain-containing protein [Pinibacter aurantiacus]